MEEEQQQQQQQLVSQCEVWSCDAHYVLSEREIKASGVLHGSATDNHEAVTFLKQVHTPCFQLLHSSRVTRVAGFHARSYAS